MEKKSIKAEIIADSINPKRCRLTTFVLTFPRIILAELNTHRMFSKNSSSSRAIKFSRMVDMIENDPFIPIRFQKDHKGMQGTEYYAGEAHDQCVKDWLHSRDLALEGALGFELPVTKQLRNRLLEPFMWQTVILSGTDFENFFRLRNHSDAEIHFQKLADEMLIAYNSNNPNELNYGEYHIPFGDNIDETRLQSLVDKGEIEDNSIDNLKIRIAVARCARVSYFNFEGQDDYIADMKLYDRLVGQVPRHMSPTEHIAMALDSDEYFGNFRGFLQHRKMFVDENLKDERVISK